MEGFVLETTETGPAADYVRWMQEMPGLEPVVRSLGALESPAATASAIEFILEGLHLNRRLNKDRTGGGARFRR